MRPTLEASIIHSICEQQGYSCHSYKSLSGGDTNAVFRIYTNKGVVVLKSNQVARHSDLFEQEVIGLDALRISESFRVPEIYAQSQLDSVSFLIMEHIPSAHPAGNHAATFAEKLAILHRTTQSYFGFKSSNYIGTLPQYNNKHTDAATFYISQRLQPQFKLAQTKGYLFTGIDELYAYCRRSIPNEAPALIHGDLWSGNYLIDVHHQPVLIDPAVAFASREMDIAMMLLFGGFDQTIFTTYNTLFPLPSDWKARIKLWQLYYILVHVNLFGRSYFAQAQSIINHYKSRV